MNSIESTVANLEGETPPIGLNEVVITLLGRIAFPPDILVSIISKKKQNPVAYVRGYNLCDGKHTLTQISQEMDVSIGTLSPIINNWKEIGIVYEVKKDGQKFFKRLYKLEVPKFSKKATISTEESIEQIQKDLPDISTKSSQNQKSVTE